MTQDLRFTFKRPCLEISGEVGSLAELIGYMQEQSATLTLAFGDDMELVVQRIATSGEPAAAEAGAEPAKRGRGKAKVVEAVAPAPLPVPTETPTAILPPNALNAAPVAPPPPAAPVAPVSGDGIPAFLDRSNPATAAALAPPPMLPSPPLAPPSSPPPVGVLGPKVVAALDVMKAGSNGQDPTGQRLSDWLASAGVTIKGQSYDDACRAVLMISDEKLTAAGIPLALKIA